MPRPPDPARINAIKAIRDYTRELGPVEGPRRARAEFADVPTPTWHRWVQLTRDADKDLLAEAATIVPRLDQPVPPLTQPDRVSVRRAINFYSELDAMVADADLLANYAIAHNQDGTRRVKNPQMLATAHRMRATNLALAMKYSEMVWSVERVEQMHEAIVSAIMQADRETGKRRFNMREDVYPYIREKLRFAPGFFGGVHVFTGSGDVPDDWALRLVVLPPEATFGRSAQTPATDAALAILKQRGEQPRQKQNRLIFLAADADSVSRLKEQVCSVLAWQSIVADVKEGRLNLDQHQAKQASTSLDQASDGLGRMVRETYKWLLAPMQEAKPGKGIGDLQWEHFQINPAVVNRSEEIEKILKEHELLIAEWSPIHLSNLMRSWFWKDDIAAIGAVETWQKTCCYLYLPRLRDADTLRVTISAGINSRDFFGIAYGQGEGRYQGFHFAENTSVIFDDALLLIEPKAASDFAAKIAFEAAEREAAAAAAAGGAEPDRGGPGPSTGRGSPSPAATGGATSTSTATPAGAVKKRVFFGTVDLDPVKAKLQFSDVADEVLMLFTQKPGVKVRISVEIEAESPAGFDDGVQRAVRENCNQLKFKNQAFEE